MPCLCLSTQSTGPPACACALFLPFHIGHDTTFASFCRDSPLKFYAFGPSAGDDSPRCAGLAVDRSASRSVGLFVSSDLDPSDPIRPQLLGRHRQCQCQCQCQCQRLRLCFSNSQRRAGGSQVPDPTYPRYGICWHAMSGWVDSLDSCAPGKMKIFPCALACLKQQPLRSYPTGQAQNHR